MAGAASRGPMDSMPTQEQLQLQLQGLQHRVERSSTRLRRLTILAALLLLLFIGMLVGIYFHYISQYARLGQVDVAFPQNSPGVAEIAFTPLSEGKVEFIRESPAQTETLTEYVEPGTTPDTQKRSFTWSSQESGAYTIWVRYREGLGVARKQWRASGKR